MPCKFSHEGICLHQYWCLYQNDPHDGSSGPFECLASEEVLIDEEEEDDAII